MGEVRTSAFSRPTVTLRTSSAHGVLSNKRPPIWRSSDVVQRQDLPFRAPFRPPLSPRLPSLSFWAGLLGSTRDGKHPFHPSGARYRPLCLASPRAVRPTQPAPLGLLDQTAVTIPLGYVVPEFPSLYPPTANGSNAIYLYFAEGRSSFSHDVRRASLLMQSLLRHVAVLPLLDHHRVCGNILRLRPDGVHRLRAPASHARALDPARLDVHGRRAGSRLIDHRRCVSSHLPGRS